VEKTKEFQAEVNLERMMAYGLTLPADHDRDFKRATRMSAAAPSRSANSPSTFAASASSPRWKTLQYRTDPAGRRACLVSDVAKVQIGYAPRLGLAGRDDTTTSSPVFVLMQKLERTMDVVSACARPWSGSIPTGPLPPGVKIVTFYDRGDLVAITVQTVLHNLLFGVALIFLIQWVFLGNLRCALIVAATISGSAPALR